MSEFAPGTGVWTADGDTLEFRVRKALLIFGCWTAYGVLMALRYIVTQSLAGRRVESLRILAGELTYAWLWAAATPLLWRVSARFPVLKWSQVRRLLLHAGLQPVEVVGGALRVGGGGEDRPLVLFQHLEP